MDLAASVDPGNTFFMVKANGILLKQFCGPIPEWSNRDCKPTSSSIKFNWDGAENRAIIGQIEEQIIIPGKHGCLRMLLPLMPL